MACAESIVQDVPNEIREAMDHGGWNKALQRLEALLEGPEPAPAEREALDYARVQCLVALAEDGRLDYKPAIEALRDYLYRHPDSPRIASAYYALGKAYAAVGYNPEALAYLKIAALDYPQSPVAPEALAATARLLDRLGRGSESRELLEKSIRQYPDTYAADEARLVLGAQVLAQGNIPEAEQYFKRVLDRTPNVRKSMPSILFFQGCLAEARGDDEEARRHWTHYLNVIRAPENRAEALFRIAESYRKGHECLKARKYYMILKQELSSQPEALFSRFRLAQLKDRERQHFETYLDTIPDQASNPDTLRLFEDILRLYPSHPLTQEVTLELVAYHMRLGRYIDVLNLALGFIEGTPKAPLLARIIEATERAYRAMETSRQTPEDLRQAVDFGVTFLERHAHGSLSPTISRATQVLWPRLIEGRLATGAFVTAFEEANAFMKAFPESTELPQVKALAKRTLVALDREFLAKRQFLELVNYHYANETVMRTVALPRHSFNLGLAWRGLGLPEAAIRAFYQAWQLDPPRQERPELLLTWAETAMDHGDWTSAGKIFALLSTLAPEAAANPWTAALKSRLSAHEGNWRDALRRAELVLNETEEPWIRGKALRLALEAAIRIGAWKQTQNLWPALQEASNKEDQKTLLVLWGDEALKKEAPEEALKAYERAIELDPEDPAMGWRLTLALEQTGKAGKAREQGIRVSRAADNLWALAGAALVGNQAFWQGPAGLFRPGLEEARPSGSVPSTASQETVR